MEGVEFSYKISTNKLFHVLNTWTPLSKDNPDHDTDHTMSTMAATRIKTCMVCGLTDGHTLIDCPLKCDFCENSVKSCGCFDSSLVGAVVASENPEDSDYSVGDVEPISKAASAKRKGEMEDG